MFMDEVSAKQAIRICGFETVAMLDYLQRSGVYVPSARRTGRRGKGRRYNFRDLMVLRAISLLLRNGASVSVLKNALIEFQNSKWEADRASLQYEGEAFKYFVVDGNRIHFVKSNRSFYDLSSSGQMSFAFVVDVDRIHSEVILGLQQRELPFNNQ